MTGPENSAPDGVRHVVHLILENRSFDQMLGCMKAVCPELEGIDPAAPMRNSDDAGREFVQAPTTVRQMLKWDPHHEVLRVAVQLADHNQGFVKDFSQQYPDSTVEARQLIMDYFPLDFLPALHKLARNFTICDHWFASVPGPTWPNRFFALTGTSNGRVNMPDDGTQKADLDGYFQQTQETLFDRLNERAVHWKAYYHDIPQTTVLKRQRQPHNVARYFHIDRFYADARGPVAEFPEYCLIEPDFMGYGQNDAHPPHDIMRSEKLIADVYNAIRANDELWKSTLLIIMYDEHGGFYDHVVPPGAIAPDDAKPSEYSFDQLGVRVPAVLVSPWMEARVESTQFDHTSVLKYLSQKWQLGPLGRRTAAATGIGVAFRGDAPRTGMVERITLTADELNPPDPKAEEEAFGAPSAHQSALKQLAAYLEIEAFEDIPKLSAWSARMAEAIKTIADAVLDRILDVPTGIKVSMAEPDKLALPMEASAKDSVTKFLMRMKRYAAKGLKDRLADDTLPSDQQQHALHTLSLISGRNFHQENGDGRLTNARIWLGKQT
jgi:phospholipase C